jgi:hypothetical protein
LRLLINGKFHLVLNLKHDPIAFILRSRDVVAKAKLDMILGFQH